MLTASGMFAREKEGPFWPERLKRSQSRAIASKEKGKKEKNHRVQSGEGRGEKEKSTKKNIKEKNPIPSS